MRNLTITRRKSYVGCLMKDLVYIRDEQARELIIDGVPCRKIGDLKNGETKTFQIEDGEQQVFLVVDKVSKDYCNASVTIPGGQEDVALSGVHKFYFGSNPFRFDGVELSEEQLAKQKKNNRKGATITIIAAIAGLALGFFLTKSSMLSPKTFTAGDFQITLTKAFEPAAYDGVFAFYQSKSAMIFVIREDKASLGDITLEEYQNLVLENNGKAGLKTSREGNLIWFEYTDAPGGEEIYYFVVCCQGEDAFWIVNFATPANNRDEYKSTFLEWANSINVN